MSVEIAKHLFTVEQYERMIETGILTKHDRVELIGGEIVEMSPIGSSHAACVNRLNTLLVQKLGRGAIVSVQNPVMLDDRSEPQPDLALLKWRDDFYGQSRPTPDDVLLLIEVSDTTLKYDRQVKAPLYARAGVRELWVVNLQDEEVEVYSQPAEGAYRLVRRAGRGETVNSESVPGLALEVNAALG
jgi:Uma2 family endonuclease